MNIGTRYHINKSYNVVNNNTNGDDIKHVGKMDGNDFEYKTWECNCIMWYSFIALVVYPHSN